MRIRDHKLLNNRLSMIAVMLSALCFGVFSGSAVGQDAAQPNGYAAARFRMGEKLTYNVSFGKYSNVAYLEMSVVSDGKLSGHDVVELRSKLKMLGFVSAAFFQFDENRTVFADPGTGLPLYVSKTSNYGVLPKETVEDYLKEPTTNFDLLSLMYRVRAANGVGSFQLFQDGQVYTVTLEASRSEKMKTEAGEFDTIVCTVESDYLKAKDIKQIKINLSADENRIPVLIRVKTTKELFTASLATVHMPKPPADVTPSPSPSQTTAPAATPPPKATPAPYIENQPISSELGFVVGESQEYSVSENGKPIARITLAAKERKMFQNEDSLLLTATVTGIEQGNGTFVLGDSINAQVDPETLAPRWIELKFAGALKTLNRTVIFDPRTGNITFGGPNPVDAPIGTHSILSLIYAMRSFNLKPSKDVKNPVNDTRVAVFWGMQPYIFTLLPSNPEEITVSGEKIMTQLISITTGNGDLDKKAPKIWLSANGRVPVRFSLGNYQADLVSLQKTFLNDPEQNGFLIKKPFALVKMKLKTDFI